MSRRFWSLFPLAITLLAGPAFAQARHTQDDAMALVGKAAVFLQSHPRDVAFAAFDDPHGAFVDGDLYLYVLDAVDGKLTMLAHGVNHGLIGMPQKEVVDAEGKDFNEESITLVSSKGEGWVTYKWPNPLTRKISTKTSYVKLVDGVIIGSGVYK